jgi:hypothetical protein
MLSSPAYPRVLKLDPLRRDPHHRPLGGAPEEHEVIDAVHLHERREIVAAVRVHQHARLGRPRRRVAARGARHQARQHAGAEDQRNLGIERRARLVEQFEQVEHVRAAAGEQLFDDGEGRVGAIDRLPFEIDEQGGALTGILRLLRHFGEERGDAIAHGHRGKDTGSRLQAPDSG